MKSCQSLLIILTLAALGLPMPQHAIAADAAPAPVGSTSSTLTEQQRKETQRLDMVKIPAEMNLPKAGSFTLEIRNGVIMEGGKPTRDATIGAIMEYLKKQNALFSLALGPGVANVKVGDLILRQPEFEIGAICQAISNCTAGAVEADNPGGGQSWTLVFAQAQSREVAVFNLTNYLNPDGKAEDKAIQEKLASVTDIIFKTLTDLDPAFSDATQPHYQFHRGANLLVVTGSHQAMQVAGQVVQALTMPTPSRAPFADNYAQIASRWANSDPAAAALAWATTLPTSDSNANEQVQKKIAELQTQLKNSASLSGFQWANGADGAEQIQQMQEIQKQLDELTKRLRDFNSKASAVPPTPPPPTLR